MIIELKPEDEKLVQEKLRSGAFRSVEEVIHRALVALPTPEPVTLQSGSRGKRQPGKKSLVEVFAPLREMLQEGELHFGRNSSHGRSVDL
ncbi:MAG: hypothetical protein JST93_18530 [Acidobacteria bacterium]|nr:hypothetical protein [Acidobacteriota bacterium]